jgi:hypothetical protein
MSAYDSILAEFFTDVQTYLNTRTSSFVGHNMKPVIPENLYGGLSSKFMYGSKLTVHKCTVTVDGKLFHLTETKYVDGDKEFYYFLEGHTDLSSKSYDTLVYEYHQMDGIVYTRTVTQFSACYQNPKYETWGATVLDMQTSECELYHSGFSPKC